ncbi:MAG TPA: hypothetical protein VFH02_03605 [Jiangellaceae bacterium]|nr:hypothetical protein [Jiangellaceae bacterium]
MPTGNSRPCENGPADQTPPTLRDASPIESYLRGLVDAVDDVPLIVDLVEADLGTPRGTASIARAALRWLLDGTDDAIRARLGYELEVADLLARWRVRMAGLDVRGTTDWSRVQEVVMARREVAA